MKKKNSETLTKNACVNNLKLVFIYNSERCRIDKRNWFQVYRDKRKAAGERKKLPNKFRLMQVCVAKAKRTPIISSVIDTTPCPIEVIQCD